ncbi:MAG: glycosyltransferase [Actinomycetota bacterium]|nr:glycosyltransferase [Actinomycetota bacterium]
MSVIMAVHGDQPFIDEQLASLAAQTYSGWWEVVIADNCCSPATLARIDRWMERLPSLRVIDARARTGANFARNEAARHGVGELLAICDSDDVTEPTWLAALCVAAQAADLVGGHLDVALLNSTEVQSWRPSPTAHGLPEGMNFLPYVAGSNCAIWRDVYDSVGGCDEDLIGGGGGDDVDLSWRVQLAGGRIAFAADAVVHYRLRPDLRSLWDQMGSYGVSAARLYKKFRSSGAQRADALTALKIWVRLVQRAPGALRSSTRRGHWLREVAYLLGRLRGAVRYRVVYW